MWPYASTAARASYWLLSAAPRRAQCWPESVDMGLIRALEREGEILATEPVADLSDAETVETVLYTSVSKQVEADCTDTGKNQKESGRGRGGERERERERERE